MAITNKKGINITSPFKYIGGQPLDVRLVAEDEADLQSIITKGAVYNGLTVWVNSLNKHMTYNGSAFVPTKDAPVDLSSYATKSENDSKYATKSSIPTKLSQLTNDINYATTEDVERLREIAEGKTSTYIVETLNSLSLTNDGDKTYTSSLQTITVLNDEGTAYNKQINITSLKKGDVILVKETEAPDLYVISATASTLKVAELETRKISLEDYATKDSVQKLEENVNTLEEGMTNISEALEDVDEILDQINGTGTGSGSGSSGVGSSGLIIETINLTPTYTNFNNLYQYEYVLTNIDVLFNKLNTLGNKIISLKLVSNIVLEGMTVNFEFATTSQKVEGLYLALAGLYNEVVSVDTGGLALLNVTINSDVESYITCNDINALSLFQSLSDFTVIITHLE